jgi:hypothetical protein
MLKDRSYYRQLDTNQLEEEVYYGLNVDWQELCIALSERIEAIRNETIAAMEMRY